jgi:hypothetical protein
MRSLLAMPTLFISHASEDKDAFARPLAEALRGTGMKVWFDEYELTLGDSLRERIDHGLKNSDYGVVILSRAFFAKKWTKAELDGLLALEEINRKMILPIWLGVSEDEVKAFSPMLAGRLAGSGDKGVDAVVVDIQRAIATSSRAIKVANSLSGTNALRSIGLALQSKEIEQRAMFSFEDVRLVQSAYEELCAKLAAEGEAANEGLEKPYFTVKGNPSHGLSVEGPFHVMVHVYLKGLGINSAKDHELYVRYATGESSEIGQMRYSIYHQDYYLPRLLEGVNARWARPMVRDDAITTPELIDSILANLASHIESRKK